MHYSANGLPYFHITPLETGMSHKQFPYGHSFLRHLIVAQCRLQLGHNLLPNFSVHLTLNSSNLCTLYPYESFCDFQHILFDWSALEMSRAGSV